MLAFTITIRPYEESFGIFRLILDVLGYDLLVLPKSD